MKLGKTVAYPELDLCPYVGAPLCGLHMPSGFGGRAKSETNRGKGFPAACQAHRLGGGLGAGDEGARVRAPCEPGLLLGHWQLLP